MPLINVAIVLIAIGVLLWVVDKFIPMEPNIKSILNAVVIIVVVIWILSLFLGWHNLGSLRIGK